MKKKEKFKNTANQNILNLITPSGLSFSKNSLMIGENHAKIISVTKYPSNPSYGWLSQITSIEGTTSKIEFIPTESGNLIERCNEQIRTYRMDLAQVKDESVRLKKERAIEDITKMIQRIDQDGEVVGYVNIMLLIQGITQEKLEERVKKVQSIIATIGGSTRNILFLQREAYRAVSPYGTPNQVIHDMGSRNMPLSTFIGGFVNASSGINDGTGYLIGKTDNGKPIIIDTRKRGGDRTNMNWIITGVPGVGKSATVKNIGLREYALGAKEIYLDPEREYVEMVLNLGGKVINCGGGQGGRINPLQVRPAPKLNTDELEKGEDDIYQDEGKGSSDLALHFQTLRTFHRIYKKQITELEMAKLEEILEGTYRRFGIEWETDISRFSPKDFPIYSDLYEDIEKAYANAPDNQELKNLAAYFRSIAAGADSYIFNGYTDIDFETDIIDLDISSLLDGDESILRAQFHNINSFVWQYISLNREEIVLYIVDEGYLIVDPQNPEALIFLKNVSKRIRKYGGGILFITHSVVDVLDPEVKRHGQALIDNACYKFIMGTDGKNLEETKELFNLTEAEENLLLAKQRGRGLLYVGSSRINARIEIPEKFLSLMGSAGGK